MGTYSEQDEFEACPRAFLKETELQKRLQRELESPVKDQMLIRDLRAQIAAEAARPVVTPTKGLFERFTDWLAERRAKKAEHLAKKKFERVGTGTFPIQSSFIWSNHAHREIIHAYFYQNGYGERKIEFSQPGYEDFIKGQPYVRAFLDGDSLKDVQAIADQYKGREF